MDTMFALGQLVSTPSIPETFTPEETAKCLARHQSGDWGDTCSADKRLNDLAVKDGGRLISSYKFEDGRKLWVITEHDRSVTTLTKPEEY